MYISGLSIIRPPIVYLADLVGHPEKLHKNGIAEEYLLPFLCDAALALQNKDEFATQDDLNVFAAHTGLDRVLLYHGQGASELAANAVQELLDYSEDKALQRFDYIFYCHSSIDKEFMISPACRMQYVTGARAAIPMSISQFGTVSCCVGLDLASRIFAANSADRILLVAVDQLVYPSVRRVGNLTIGGDAAAAVILTRTQDVMSTWRILACSQKCCNDINPEDDVIDQERKLSALGAHCAKVLLDDAQVPERNLTHILPPSLNQPLANRVIVDLQFGQDRRFEEGRLQHGNLSSADLLSNLVALDEADAVATGDLVLVMSAGLPGVTGSVIAKRL